MSKPSTLDAAAAAALLGVKPATLYAYVSRGLLRSQPGPSARERTYLRTDVERLRQQRRRRRTGEAQGVLHWGEPVLPSRITQIEPAGPRYRGRAVAELLEEDRTFEQVAELLWTGTLPPASPRWSPGPLGSELASVASAIPRGAPPLTRLAVLVPAVAARDPGRFDRSPALVLRRARQLVALLAAGLAPTSSQAAQSLGEASVARVLCRALDVPLNPANERLLQRTLILWADHELNVSSFAARVVASAHADLYSCVSAGLAALSGPRHGAACEQVEALVAETREPERAEEVLNARARRGEALPGFGHPLYPAGDPRAVLLLEEAAKLAPADPQVRTVLALSAAMRDRGSEPTIDVGLIAAAGALGLPRGAAPGLIAVGRCVGWVAHVLEHTRSPK